MYVFTRMPWLSKRQARKPAVAVIPEPARDHQTGIDAQISLRALRLIADGLVDVEGVTGLAQRLAVSQRHLHRELVTQIGVGPLALARRRRAQTAKLLLDQTHFSLTDIAFASGFPSIRSQRDEVECIRRRSL